MWAHAPRSPGPPASSAGAVYLIAPLAVRLALERQAAPVRARARVTGPRGG
ncbi:hypothetical protein [Nonomuraea sp. B1E8]|uniref:hypothetical protein n=1 Tax=unclassified Nonomuraea TaxID=2593643 RepID=UPI00325DCB3D